MKSQLERRVRSLGGKIARTSTHATHIVWRDGDSGVLRRAQESRNDVFIVSPAFIADAADGEAVLGDE